MRPFSVTEASKRLSDIYPEHQLMRELGRSMNSQEQLGFLRLWVSEGIPFAFRNLPILYDIVRGWLGAQLNVHPKCITIIGSARLGYSLCPVPDFGKPFSQESDLDLALVADSTFQELCRDFVTWRGDLSQGRVKPRNAREKKFWVDIIARLPENIRRGFIDPHKIPLLYSAAQRVNNAVWRLNAKLGLTPNCPKTKPAKLRVYRDWEAFVRQMMLNYTLTLESFTPNPRQGQASRPEASSETR